MQAIRGIVFALLFLVALVPTTGCDAGAKVREAQRRVLVQNDLKRLGLAFHAYSDANPGKAPAKAEDLADYLEGPTSPVFQKLQKGDYVFLYNISIQTMNAGAGVSATVLAYEKDAPTQGGHVLMGDASVKRMTVDEFKAASKGK